MGPIALPLDDGEKSPVSMFTHLNEKIEADDEEKGIVDHEKDKARAAHGSEKIVIAWMIINTLATIAIVFTNKAIFDDPSLRHVQSSFAAFHFCVTGTTLYIISRPSVGFFVPKRVSFLEMIPLASAMCLNVVLPNLSLAFSSVTFYQIARILLTPIVALINFVFYQAPIPRRAVYTLVPICLGVGVVSYYDSLPAASASIKTTSTAGVMFAFSGVVASSLYTVWISTSHKKFQTNSMQLLYNQAPISAFLLMFAIPFTDVLPGWHEVPQEKFFMIGLSGVFACLINVSQFFIIAGTGPVSSTVVGHFKTCSIVALGWITSGRNVGDRSILGILLAIAGIVL
ncbi:MAG: hypothetical protein M1827_001569 [Pycnora praestabilis]|nr:MAG: hypothetical protein M1827_001569 [Pycnora praestabilis]